MLYTAQCTCSKSIGSNRSVRGTDWRLTGNAAAISASSSARVSASYKLMGLQVRHTCDTLHVYTYV